MARGGQRRAGAARGGARGGQNGGNGGNGGGGGNGGQRRRPRDEEGIIPILARVVREVEAGVQRRVPPRDLRTRFQVVALLARDERQRVKADPTLSEAQRGEQLKRLDGIGTILAKTATREPALFSLLGEDAVVSDAALDLKRELEIAGGLEPTEQPVVEETVDAALAATRQVVPQSVRRRMLAHPFLTPDFSAAQERYDGPHRLAGWELLEPLFRSFELAGGGAASMELPEPSALRLPAGLELMPHQGRLVAAAEDGHRSFLLADEPGLGKTAQALLAARAADAYPLLVVVPNVVKTNWAREAQRWTPERAVTVIHGDGEQIDGFADVFVVNYEVLDRHVGWLGELGFRGMVVDEAHFIKNKSSQRSQHVLAIADKVRERTARPLMMALTGTPLINDIDDFRAIWQFLGWIDEKEPLPALMAKLEEDGLTPVEPGFYPRARASVVSMGIVRRRKVDVAADIPARRIADLPVELEGSLGRSIRDAERELAKRLLTRYHRALESRREHVVDPMGDGVDHELVRRVAKTELSDSTEKDGTNVFTMVRRIGQAKAGLAADYAAQLVRNVGKVVFFAKHVDVMDTAEETFAKRGIGFASIRGDQTPTVRQRNIDAFVSDPDVHVAVCSLTAAGVGLNLQVASNVVLAELSWTDAEQTQAIDRVHRIGQETPVTAWRVIASQTIDTKIAELIDSKAGLAARALDGSDEEVASSTDVQLDALVALLTDELRREHARR